MIYVSFLKRGLYSMGHEGSCQVYCMTEIIFVAFLAAGLLYLLYLKKRLFSFGFANTSFSKELQLEWCDSHYLLWFRTALPSPSLYLLISTLLLELQFLMQFKAEVLFESNRGSFRKLTEIKLCSQSKQSTPKHKTSSREEQNKLFLQAK